MSTIDSATIDSATIDSATIDSAISFDSVISFDSAISFDSGSLFVDDLITCDTTTRTLYSPRTCGYKLYEAPI
jgi:hypothetical protein